MKWLVLVIVMQLCMLGLALDMIRNLLKDIRDRLPAKGKLDDLATQNLYPDHPRHLR